MGREDVRNGMCHALSSPPQNQLWDLLWSKSPPRSIERTGSERTQINPYQQLGVRTGKRASRETERGQRGDTGHQSIASYRLCDPTAPTQLTEKRGRYFYGEQVKTRIGMPQRGEKRPPIGITAGWKREFGSDQGVSWNKKKFGAGALAIESIRCEALQEDQ